MQEDLKSLQLTVSEVGDQPEEAAAGSLTVEGVHGSRKWDVHVVAASKAEAAQAKESVAQVQAQFTTALQTALARNADLSKQLEAALKVSEAHGGQ